MVSIPQFLTAFLISGACFIVFLRRYLSRTASTPQQRLPPCPRKLPLIGNLHQLGVLPHRSLQSLSEHYGGLMLLHFGRVPVIIASSSDAACEIMKNQDLTFSNRPKLSIPDKLTYGSKDVAFAPYGEYWRQARSISVIHLLSSIRVRSYSRVREEETSIMVERIRAQLGSSSSAVVNLSDLLVSLTNDVVCRVALGRKYSDGTLEGKMFEKMIVESAELLTATCLGEYFPCLAWIDRVSGLDSRVTKAARTFDEFLQGVVEEHRRKSTYDEDVRMGSDLVDILLKLQRENKFDFLDDDAIKGIVMDMFAGGTDTTATVLIWTIAELIRNPKTMKALQNELRQQQDDIKEDDLHKMRYLKAAIKESLRLHSPVPLLVPRESTQHTKVSGYDIPKGMRVMVNAWAIGRDPLLWKNPEKFDPERFLDSDTDYRGLHFELIPFGSGRRGCPGMMFAESLIELALAKLVREFDFALPDGESEENLDMSEANGITARKSLPLILVATQSSF